MRLYTCHILFMFHIPSSRKSKIDMTVHLVSFSGKYNDTLVFCTLKVADGAFDSSSMRGFWEVSESGTLVQCMENVIPGVVG